MKVEVGMKFGRLTVIEKTTKKYKNKTNSSGFSNVAASICKCECGNTKIVGDSQLKNNNTQSCGCFRNEQTSKFNKKHGMTNSRLYSIWLGMRRRCYETTSINYFRYGGKGIIMCDKWLTFEGFYEDMGNSYKEGLTIDRIDSEGNYCKENCKWSDIFEQANNKGNNLLWPHEGKLLTTNEFAKVLGIKAHSLHSKVCKEKYGAIKRYSEDNGTGL